MNFTCLLVRNEEYKFYNVLIRIRTLFSFNDRINLWFLHRQKQPVEEYVPENTTPQFVVTLTGLDPNAYPNTPETAGKEIITTKIPNNIVIDPASKCGYLMNTDFH